jgi:hypothetical protein
VADLYTRHKTRDRDRDRDSGVRDRDQDRDSGARDRDRDETPGPRQFKTSEMHIGPKSRNNFSQLLKSNTRVKSLKSADHLNCINYKEIKYLIYSEIFKMILKFKPRTLIY